MDRLLVFICEVNFSSLGLGLALALLRLALPLAFFLSLDLSGER